MSCFFYLKSNAKKKINLFGPSITNFEIDNVSKSLKLDWFQNYNKYQQEFENYLKNFTKRKYALATPWNSCNSFSFVIFWDKERG